MNGTVEEFTSVEPSPNSLENLKQEQLAELGTDPEMLASVRAEVCRRLKNCPNKANYLTFRWFLAADDEDKADAFDGLLACCWNATKMRNRSGLFPRGYPETKQRNGGIAQETREAMMDALVDCLCDLNSLPVPEVILTALNGGFHTDADVGNAVRCKVREESRRLVQYGDDKVSEDGHLTLFEILPENPEQGRNRYDEAVELIFQEKEQIVEEVGEDGWEVLEQIVELVDNDLLPDTMRDRQRVITEIFETVYGVNARQASTLKRRFHEAFETAAADGNPVFDELLDLLGG